ncbi:MAG: tRNA pseudouridine(13) synthase TruD, partial [Polyangiales bacterium]
MATLPYLTSGIAPVDAQFRVELEDFVVDEIPAYEPSGEGDHVFVHLEKRDLTTRDAIRQLCDAVGADRGAAGWAGLKDKRAVTRQWVSLFGIKPERLAAVELPGVRVLEAIRHGQKLRTGHLRANRFRVRLREIDAPGIERAREVLKKIGNVGLPNYYGEQRFGRDGDNAVRAARWVRGEMRPPRGAFSRKIEMSALQSHLFNQCVATRIDAEALGRVYLGDVVKRHDSGGVFVVTDRDELPDTQARADRFEISATGPMFGAKMRWPEADARVREEALLEAAELTPNHLQK